MPLLSRVKALHWPQASGWLYLISLTAPSLLFSCLLVRGGSGSFGPQLFPPGPPCCSACLTALLDRPEELELEREQPSHGQQGRRHDHREEAVGVFCMKDLWISVQEASYWECKRELHSWDLQRWPPAQQAQLRQLFSSVAGDADCRRGVRISAICLLARLQVSTALRAGMGF